MKRVLGICFSTALALSAYGADKVDYMKQIKPIFSSYCYQCHSETQQKHELRVDTAAFAIKGGQSGPAIIPGKSEDSLLYQAIIGTAPDLARMPYKKNSLDESQIALIKRWIDEGAKAPADEKTDAVLHWSFVPPDEEIALPAVKNKKWVRNPVDHFILSKLEQQKIKPSPEADRITLIRRVYLDLIGLPPSIQEVDAFVQDKSPNAYEKVVDRLLSNPHFGERWGRHWLDAARYADSNGYSIDAPRQIWKYRDWVIDAFNKDMPFDQFTIEQMAGDLLPNATPEQKTATGFHRNTQINQEGGIDPEQFRIESVFDRVNTTGNTWLGLTVGCAQCHDHKFDPVTQKEFYQLFAFLNNQDEPDLTLATEEDKARLAKHKEELEELESGLVRFIEAAAEDVLAWQKSLTPEGVAALKPEITTVLETPPDKRKLKQKLLLVDQVRKDDKEYREQKDKFLKLERRKPQVTTTMVLAERKEPRKTHLFIKGDFTRLGEEVTPGVPKIMNQLPPEVSTPNRLDLGKWLVDPQNPLTARVTVNRYWMHLFGKGIVETENDFGTQGTPPTHPELLDWMAREFIKQGWSQKKMIRTLVTSSAYRQSSNFRKDLKDVDPYNKWFARQNRFRLDAEIIRDVELSASGLLTPKIGGPSVNPPIPDGVMSLGQTRREWKTSTGPDRYRRGMYTFFFRATPAPSLMVFDAPDSFSSCTRRIRSNTPLQSLNLLNDQAFFEFAQGLALRVLQEVPEDENARLDLAFRLCLSRKPAREERERLAELLKQQLQSYDEDPEEAKLLAPANFPKELDVKQVAAWTTVSRVLLNLDETISRE
ncbi:MAG: PSD1 and planctomycete cytochrome C domain-containing protein [Limisphaerales bacterium]